MASRPATVHASAVLVGPRAVLIRGPSGSGKSELALELIESARTGALLFARLVADDRVHLEAAHGRLLARPAEALAGLIEVLAYEASAVVGLGIDLAATDAQRLPDAASHRTGIQGIELPRLAVASGMAAFPAVLSYITRPGNCWL
jgi:HPr kinase/phosphorylase